MNYEVISAEITKCSNKYADPPSSVFNLVMASLTKNIVPMNVRTFVGSLQPCVQV